MVELIAQTPSAGLLPLEIGDVQVTEVDLGHLTSVAPYAGQTEAASAALQAAHGMPFPKPNRVTGKDGARAIWFGREMALLAGPACSAAIAAHAALTDQSDAWVAVTVSGGSSEDVLARLAPVDLRGRMFKRGHTSRTLIKHMTASITRTGPESFLILVFRSMARTLAHDLKEAMEAVAARL